MTSANIEELIACPREHRAVVLHAISPISMKLCQFKVSTPKLKRQTGFCFGFYRGEIDHPSRFFLVFTAKITSKSVECMREDFKVTYRVLVDVLVP